MRYQWLTIIGAGVCLGMLPACSALLRPVEEPDGTATPTAQRELPIEAAPADRRPSMPAEPALKPVVKKEAGNEPPRLAPSVTSPDLLPPPLSPAEASAVAARAEAVPPNPAPPAGAVSPAKPVEDPPLVQAFRCFINQQPAEAASLLARYDKPTQEVLLHLFPLAQRLSEGGWDHLDPREAAVLAEQFARLNELVGAPLHRLAPLSIRKMCFCKRPVGGYGKYDPLPDSHCFHTGEYAYLYVELDNLSDQPQGNNFGVRLTSTLKMHDFHGKPAWNNRFPDPPHDLSHTRRHDFYRDYTFIIPSLPPGLHTLSLKITDEATGRSAEHTLDFRMAPPISKAER